MDAPAADTLATVAAGRTAAVVQLRQLATRLERRPLDAAAEVLVLLGRRWTNSDGRRSSRLSERLRPRSDVQRVGRFGGVPRPRLGRDHTPPCRSADAPSVPWRMTLGAPPPRPPVRSSTPIARLERDDDPPGERAAQGQVLEDAGQP